MTDAVPGGARRQVEGHASSLLWVDSAGALAVGAVVAAASGPLSRLFRMPRAAVVGIGVANLACGAFSGALARRSQRSPGQIAALVGANAAWAIVCGVAAARFAGRTSALAIAHFVVEGTYVGGLAVLEWRNRDRLLSAA